MSTISKLIEQNQKAEVTVHTHTFIFKEEFRIIMTALFILFEYNLKFVIID